MSHLLDRLNFFSKSGDKYKCNVKKTDGTDHEPATWSTFETTGEHTIGQDVNKRIVYRARMEHQHRFGVVIVLSRYGLDFIAGSPSSVAAGQPSPKNHVDGYWHA